MPPFLSGERDITPFLGISHSTEICILPFRHSWDTHWRVAWLGGWFGWLAFLSQTWHLETAQSGSLISNLKGALSGLRQFVATESSLKMMENAFYFTSKAFFVLKIFKFLSWLFGHVAKRLDKKDKVNFKFYDVTAWLTNNCNTHIAQYLEK